MIDVQDQPSTANAEVAHVQVVRVGIEQGDAGAVVGTGTPRLSWQIAGADAGWQTDFVDVEFTRSDQDVQTVRLPGAESVLVAWPFAALGARAAGRIRIRAGSGDQLTPWSDSTSLEIGLLSADDWTARFISPSTIGGLEDGAPLVFTDFELDELPIRARLYASAHGVYEAAVNDARIGDDVLAPGWTSYDKRLRYQAYDVLEHLTLGANTLSMLIGNGWYRGQLVWPGNRSSYGDRLAAIAQLELEFESGERRLVVTDDSWKANPTGILSDDLYDGEQRDMRIPNVPDRSIAESVVTVPGEHSRLIARRGPAVRVVDRVHAVDVQTTPSGAVIVDFGQNLVGWVELVVRGARSGDRVVIRHAEVLERGELAMRPLRSAKVTSTYIMSGAEEEVVRPTFTFNGFRYAEITGVSDVSVDDVTALVVGSDLRRTGWFESSDPLLNRLHENVVWSTRGNFLDLPTDCPQRDERLGWTGDIQAFAPTANFLFDTSGFLAGWLEDLAADQKPDGGVPHVIPDVLREPDAASAAWGDAAAIVPASLYLSFDDREVLARQFPSMKAWVDKISRDAGDRHLWDFGAHFGDWLDPTAPAEHPERAKADPHVVATAFYARSARLVAEAAAVLGAAADAERYGMLADAVVAAFEREYVTGDGYVRSDCQTVYALALCGDLISDPHARRRAGERLVELVQDAGYRVATGFVGTPIILEALRRADRMDVAYRMLLERGVPSWLYAVTMGATTVWERWDSLLPDGSVHPGSMTSFNHYAYGAVADWMHRHIGGLEPTAPGWRRARVSPHPGGGLTNARAAVDTPYGLLASSWRIDGRRFELEVTVPYGITADVVTPASTTPTPIAAGTHHFVAEIPETTGEIES